MRGATCLRVSRPVFLLLWTGILAYHFLEPSALPNQHTENRQSLSRSRSFYENRFKRQLSEGTGDISRTKIDTETDAARTKEQPELLLASASEPAGESNAGIRASNDVAGSDPCEGMHVYVYEDLVAQYNDEILAGCENLGGHSMCDALLNEGRGVADEELCRWERKMEERSTIERGERGSDWQVQLDDGKGSFGGKSADGQLLTLDTPDNNCSWFRTNQFSLEVLFHHRLRTHPCRVRDPSDAQLFFVPFYTGLEIKRTWANHPATANRFNQVFYPLLNSPYFQKRRGMDHFMAFGRMGMEFGFYGEFLTLLRNVTKVMIEVGWTQEGLRTGHEIGVPYPTGFHPAELADVKRHQERVRRARRDVFVSYAGAVDRPYGIWAQRFGTAQLRARLAHECGKMPNKCRSVICDYAWDTCSPAALLDLFMSSTFCLQPQGDSPTRRSTFDALLAGCIPIFFHADSFQSQYQEILGVNASDVSIFIPPERLGDRSWSLEGELEGIDDATRGKMQNAIVDLIPRILYGKKHTGVEWKDAVDFALAAVKRKAFFRSAHMRRILTKSILR